MNGTSETVMCTSEVSERESLLCDKATDPRIEMCVNNAYCQWMCTSSIHCGLLHSSCDIGQAHVRLATDQAHEPSICCGCSKTII